MAIRSYSPTDIQILLAGFYKLDGFTEGSFVTIEKDVQPYKTTRTIDGQVGRTFIKDDTYTITINLASTSPANDILNAIYSADSISQFAKFPLFIKDSLGSSLFLAPTCWIKEVPSMEYSTTVTQRTWVIQGTQCFINFGGNEEASSAIQDLANTALGGVGSLIF
ncbi:MAG: putative structural protein [Prokaryotic dsDNA virus sp.]|jgi:hypothetical protein|nr:MAG: putative structural protein [Prokaryotic dsDNA virus sp.]|tara:strand:- start:1254 stop:1748 length:495 start_codon:yes stop_codon:yes gene_type:complete